MANKKYKVKNSNLLHNGKLYKIGDVLELDETLGKKLSDVLTCVGSAENKTKTQSKTKTDSTKDGGEQ